MKNKVILAVILTISVAFSTVCAVSDAKQYKDKSGKQIATKRLTPFHDALLSLVPAM